MTAATTTTAPEVSDAAVTHMKNSAGHLVPIELVKPIDIERDKLVGEIVAAAQALNAVMRHFKAQVFGDIAAFVELSVEEYGVKPRGQKGNVTLSSFDGRYKVQHAVAEYIRFDERLIAAKQLIDECIADWSANARPEIHALINSAFQVDKAGNINTARVLALRRVAIEDERWLTAMRAIGEAIQVVGSKAYVRVYERVGDTDQYRAIPLDVAAV